MLQPTKKTRLYEEIVNKFIELIKKGDLKKGDRLPSETELCNSLNVSRSTIREAFRALETMGYISSEPGGATYVSEVTLDNIIKPFASILKKDKKLMMDLTELRLLLETETTRLAAKRMTKENLKAIKDSIGYMKAEIENGSIGLKGDNLFHTAVAHASCNEAIEKIFIMCNDLISKSREYTLNIKGQPEKSVEDHKKIFLELEKKNTEKAVYYMKKHLKKAYRNIDDIY